MRGLQWLHHMKLAHVYVSLEPAEEVMMHWGILIHKSNENEAKNAALSHSVSFIKSIIPIIRTSCTVAKASYDINKRACMQIIIHF